MTDITEIPEGGVPSTRELRIFEFLIDGVIAHSCARHYEADTQEHQLTSRIAQAIEHELGNVRIGETRVRIAVQELSDRGRGSKERAVGADLYISIVVESEDESISKGMLVQSKWDHAFSRSSELGRLRDQSHEMLRRSKES
jgi:N-acetylmuramoyl-L-alanine amidase